MGFGAELMAAEASAIAVPNTVTLTNLAVSTALPGWIQRVHLDSDDGTCTADSTTYELYPIGYCQRDGQMSFKRFECDGTDLVKQQWDDAWWNMCDDSGETVSPKCDVGLAETDLKALDVCIPTTYNADRTWGQESGDNDTCVEVTLANADDLRACIDLCDADTSTPACYRVAYNPETKACNGYAEEACGGEDSVDGWVSTMLDSNDRMSTAGCGTETPLPGGVITYFGLYESDERTTLTQADCTTTLGTAREDANDDSSDPARDNFAIIDEKFFVFDHCMQDGTGNSSATYCVSTEVVHSVWMGSTTCSGAPTTSYKFTDTCVLKGGNDPKLSMKVTWWGACGAATPEIPAKSGNVAGKGVATECVPPQPVDPICTCEDTNGVGNIDAVWGDSTCGAVVGEHGCAAVSAHLAESATAEDAALWQETCCGAADSSSTAVTALFATLAGVAIAALGL